MRLLIPILLLTGVLSCKQKTDPGMCTDVCKTVPYHLSLPKYAIDQVDTIIVRTFDNDSSFANVLSEELHFRYNDSFTINVPNVFTGFTISAELDYEFIIPATADTFRVWNTHIEQITKEWVCPEDGRPRPTSCYNYMTPRAAKNGVSIAVTNGQENSYVNRLFVQLQ